MGASVDRNPVGKGLSVVPDRRHLTSNKGGLLLRDPQGAEVEDDSVSQTGQYRKSSLNPRPEGPPDLTGTRTFVPRDWARTCHPLISGEKGDQSHVSSRYTSHASDTDDTSVESREPRGILDVNVKEEENSLLATHQGLLKEKAEMEETTKARELLEAG